MMHRNDGLIVPLIRIAGRDGMQVKSWCFVPLRRVGESILPCITILKEEVII